MTELMYASLESPIGTVYITGSGRGVHTVSFAPPSDAVTASVKSCVLETVLQLEQYFLGKQTAFHSLPLVMHGTDFQQRVWDALLGVPFGETITYGELAQSIGADDAARAVGNALNKNPLAIVVPCHRVVPASGQLGQYAGGIEKKEWLLRHEGLLSVTPSVKRG